MAFQICPKCKQEGFLWTSWGEPYVITTWHCSICGYDATEDERLERTCNVCNTKNQSRLVDVESEFWWCFHCNSRT
jgi:hypothetical protein